MTETTPGREPVQIVEIVQPLCANTFGSAPCTATGTNDEKCYNTRATCLDTANYDGSSTLSLYFARGRVGEQGITGSTGASENLQDESANVLQDESGNSLLSSLTAGTGIPYIIPSLVSVFRSAG